MNSKQMGFFGATVDNNWKHSSSGISISSPPSTAVMMRKTIKPVIEWFSTAQITIMWNEHDENTLPQLHKILINLPHAKDLSVRACRWAQQKGIGEIHRCWLLSIIPPSPPGDSIVPWISKTIPQVFYLNFLPFPTFWMSKKEVLLEYLVPRSSPFFHN